MPISYMIRRKEGLVISRHIGEVSDQELINTYRQLLSRPDYQPSFNKLVDLRETDSMHISVEALQCVADLVKTGHAGNTKKCRTAIVAPHDFSYGLARIYQVLNDETPEETRVFRHMEEAMHWLELEQSILEAGRGGTSTK